MVEIKKFAVPQTILWILLIICAFFLGSLYTKVQYLESTKTTTTTATTTTQTAPQAAPGISLDTIKGLFSKDIIKFGDAKRKLLLVEVADPSCPFCHMAGGDDPELNATSAQFKLVSQGGTYVPPVPEFKNLVDTGKAAFVYIYEPGHGNGEMGIRALYCAFEKGKFWEVHNLIMSEKGYEIQNGYDASNTPATGIIVKNDKTKSQDLANFLAPAIDPGFMKSCLDSGKYDSRLASDAQLASTLGVQGTPGFFVNTTPFAGAYSYKDMESAVNAALK